MCADAHVVAAAQAIPVEWDSWGLVPVEAPVLAPAALVDPEVKVEATRARVCSCRRRLHEVSQEAAPALTRPTDATCHIPGVAEHVSLAVTL
jgi:hypothetical protein